MSQLLINFEPTEESDFVHRVRTFAQAISRELAMNDMGTVPDLESAGGPVIVRISTPQYAASILRAVRSLLARHNLAHRASVIAS